MRARFFQLLVKSVLFWESPSPARLSPYSWPVRACPSGRCLLILGAMLEPTLDDDPLDFRTQFLARKLGAGVPSQDACLLTIGRDYWRTEGGYEAGWA